ncbi:CCR4B [Auxenochlorella protothecoides x Auxenochlorella symbiontica]
MAKQRKLQGEMEAALKKIAEGVDEWEDLWNKYERSHDMDAAQRERLVAEMKRDLKKLQRLREAVRGWLANNEVRVAKDTLEKARRSIEIQMERFRVVEKDVKGKAHMGLGRDALDPAAAAKQQCADWLTDVMDRLQTEIEACEADVENLGPAGNKAKKTRLAELQGLIARHQQHVTHLEQTLRLLRNDQVEAEEVEDALKEGLEAYLDTGGEAFDPGEDEGLYASLPLEEVDANVGKLADPVTPKVAPVALPEEPAKKAKPGKPTPIKTKPVKEAPKIVPVPIAAAPPRTSPLVTAAQVVAAGPGAAAVAAKAQPAGAAPPPPAPAAAAVARRAEAEAPPPAPRGSGPPAAPSGEGCGGEGAVAPVAALARLALGGPGEEAPADAQAAAASPSAASAASGTPVTEAAARPPAKAAEEAQAAGPPFQLQDPGTNVLGPMACIQALHWSFASRPTADDAMWRDLGGNLSGLEQASLALQSGTGSAVPFEKVKDDALFFAFYFQPGTLRQAAAIKELHARGWLWHTTLHTWMTRAEQPKVLAPTYEQGVFCYWDSELRAGQEAGQPISGWSSHLTAPTFVLDYSCLDTAVA